MSSAHGRLLVGYILQRYGQRKLMAGKGSCAGDVRWWGRGLVLLLVDGAAPLAPGVLGQRASPVEVRPSPEAVAEPLQGVPVVDGL
ncbi:hypothetical protein [Streptomyces sp. NPDC059122]|uniref:hypothetical protein n=1 Tax=Streptomyces sp. NPDC059122 TaxID=3346732 RepID=UPI00367A09BC